MADQFPRSSSEHFAPTGGSAGAGAPSAGGSQRGWPRFLRYLLSREFLVTVGGLLVLGLGSLFLFFWVILPAITLQNEAITVPRVVNMKLAPAKAKLQEKHLKAQVDWQYKPDLPPNTVLSQQPRNLMRVKPGRKVYLIVNQPDPPTVKLPKVTSTNIKQAEYMLENWGLKVGEIRYVTSEPKNEVKAAYHQGEEIEPGDEVQKGAEIDLVVRRGLGKKKVEYPNLEGQPLSNATALLKHLGLDLGQINYKQSDKPTGMVLRQLPSPRAKDSVREGVSVDLQVAGESKEAVQKAMETMEGFQQPDSLQQQRGPGRQDTLSAGKADTLRRQPAGQRDTVLEY